jgi:hypothetical protein
MVSILIPAEVLIAARRLAGARPHLAAVAGIVHREDLWKLRESAQSALNALKRVYRRYPPRVEARFREITGISFPDELK